MEIVVDAIGCCQQMGTTDCRSGQVSLYIQLGSPEASIVDATDLTGNQEMINAYDVLSDWGRRGGAGLFV